MATLEMMYPARGVWIGVRWGGCYLKSGGSTPLGGLYNMLVFVIRTTESLRKKYSDHVRWFGCIFSRLLPSGQTLAYSIHTARQDTNRPSSYVVSCEPSITKSYTCLYVHPLRRYERRQKYRNWGGLGIRGHSRSSANKRWSVQWAMCFSGSLSRLCMHYWLAVCCLISRKINRWWCWWWCGWCLCILCSGGAARGGLWRDDQRLDRSTQRRTLCCQFVFQIYTAFSSGFYRARCNIYISRLCYDVSVSLSVRLSVTEVHWRIIANLGGHAACGRIISRHASQC